MNFSELFKHSGKCRWAPNGRLLATTDKYQLFVRNADTLQITQIFTCLDAISQLEWSPDSQYILCAQNKRRIVQVWSIDDPEWTCKIDEGLAGLTRARWAPDGRHILTTTEFQLRITIWSLVRKSVSYIRFPKFSDKGMDFSNDGKYLAVVERKEFKDYMGIYYCDTWELVKHFPLETFDLIDIKWSPDDSTIACWDNPLEYKLVLYTPDGRKLASHRAYENILGIKSVDWSPSGQFLAVGAYDENTLIFNNVTWKTLAQYGHSGVITDDSVVVYSEQELDIDKNSLLDQLKVSSGLGTDVSSDSQFRHQLRELKQGHLERKEGKNKANTGKNRNGRNSGANSSKAKGRRGARTSRMGSGANRNRRSGKENTQTDTRGDLSSINATNLNVPSKYVVEEVPMEVPQITPDPDKPNPKLGIGMMGWSVGDRFLFTRNDNMPNTLWIWDTTQLSLTSIINQAYPIRSACWDPQRERLAVSTTNGKLYMWSPEGCSIVDVPAVSFRVRGLRWNDDGNSIMLIDKTRFCVCYLG